MFRENVGMGYANWWFVLKLEFKEERYKYTLNQIESDNPNFRYENLVFPTSFKKTYRKRAFRIKDEKIIPIINSLKSNVPSESEPKDDW